MPTTSCSPSQGSGNEASDQNTLFAVTHTATFGRLVKPQYVPNGSAATGRGAAVDGLSLLQPRWGTSSSPVPSPRVNIAAPLPQAAPSSTPGLSAEWQKRDNFGKFAASPSPSLTALGTACVPPRKSSTRARSQSATPLLAKPFEATPLPLQNAEFARNDNFAEPLRPLLNTKRISHATQSGSHLSSDEASSLGADASLKIITPPTLGVVPLACIPVSIRPALFGRIGEVSYLGHYPGDEDSSRCAKLLRDYSFASLHMRPNEDIFELSGSQEIKWLVSPSLRSFGSINLRLGINQAGETKAVLQVFTTETVSQELKQMLHRPQGVFGHDVVEQLEKSVRAKRVTPLHFVHSLVMGELFGHLDVADLINLSGVYYGFVQLYDAPDVHMLLQQPRHIRKILARRVFLSLAKVLRDLHSRQAIHYNVCLENLLLGPHYRCTLSGFLSCHFVGENNLPSERVPTHIPPEGLSHKQHQPAIDLWGLGMMLMQLLTGTHKSVSALRAAAPWAMNAHDGSELAEALATDQELAVFVMEHGLVADPAKRMKKDQLVRAAAEFCQAVTVEEQNELDRALFDSDLPLCPHPRPDVVKRMDALLPLWKEAILGTL